MRIKEWLRNIWLDIAWVTIDDLDHRFECLENKLIEIGNKIMATLETLDSDTKSALAAATTYISDVKDEVAVLAKQISDLKATLANVGLSSTQQSMVDDADSNVQSLSSSLNAADAAIKAALSDDSSTPPVDGGSTPAA